jgi:hypothetical protein
MPQQRPGYKTHTVTGGRLHLSGLKRGDKKGVSADPHPEGQIGPGAVKID